MKRLQKERTASILKELAARFVHAHSNKLSLITITDFRLTDDLKHGTFLISVYPDASEAKALDFVRRKRTELRKFLKNETRAQHIPFLEFELDGGEKNRRRIDELLKGA
jgi:ribosome-binding factor A